MKVAFPSLAFFQALQTLMRQDEPRFRRLGFVDTTFGVHIVGSNGQEWCYVLAFEVFNCCEVAEVSGFDLTAIDFVLKGDLSAERAAEIRTAIERHTHPGKKMSYSGTLESAPSLRISPTIHVDG